MSYSTTTEFDNNLIILKQANIALAEKQSIIDEADKVVEIDLSAKIDSATISAITPIPKELNLLSQYKAAEIALIKRFSANRGNLEENPDIVHWNKLYTNLLQKLLNGIVIAPWLDRELADISFPLDNDEFSVINQYRDEENL